MEIFLGQLIGFVVGILSSIAVLYLLSFTKPKLIISPVTAHEKKENELHIRVLNKGRHFVADLNIELFIGEKSPGGKIIRLLIPPLNRDSYPALAPIQRWHDKGWNFPTSITVKAGEASQILELLNQESEGERRIVLIVTGTDAITSSRAIIRTTFSLEQIREGNFVSHSLDKVR